MADRYAMDANNALNPVYAQAQQQLAQQVPQTQALYDSLLGGLQQTGQQATIGIVADAERRGLTRPTLSADTQMAMDEAIMQAAAQIRRKKAEEEAALLQNSGQLDIGRVQGANTLAENVQAAQQTEQKAQQSALETQREFDLKNTQLTRQDQLSRISGSSGGSRGGGTSDAVDEMYAAMDAVKGKDGRISPKEWNRLRQQWKDAGLSLRKFDNNSAFKKFINPVHQKQGKEKLGRYKGQPVSDKRG